LKNKKLKKQETEIVISQVTAAGPTIYVIGGEFMLGRSNWNRAGKNRPT
jgi:hypothetical protein